MSFTVRGISKRLVALAGAATLSTLLTLGAAQAQDNPQSKSYVMKISIPTVNDSVHQFAKNFAAAVERDSAGRIKTEVYPGSQLGSVPRQIEGAQFGAIQCVVIPPEFFVGVDERFEVMAAPGLVGSMAQGQRLAADPEVRKLMLGLGADKGLHGVALFMVNPNDLLTKAPINNLTDFKGKKLRVLASQFETVPFERLGATPVAMPLGDVLSALQQGAIDGALSGMPVFAGMHFRDAAKYVTQIGQPAVFAIVELSKNWFDTLPLDLQQIVERDAATEAVALNAWASDLLTTSYRAWTDSGGELIKLPPDELSLLIKTLSAAAEEVANRKPAVGAAYRIVKEAAAHAE
jgi:TRAP-type C4-dicarboxylate transport system substrate-binding protein